MTAHVVTVSMDDTLGHVRQVFERHRFHHLVVVEHGKVVGVLSDRDLLKNISPFVGQVSERNMDRWSVNKKVHQVMTRSLVSVTRETPIGDACRLLLAHRVSCLPVVNERGGCAGIVTWRDLLNWALIDCAGGDRSCAVPGDRAA
jgi:acetoin utilization protein AcuB